MRRKAGTGEPQGELFALQADWGEGACGVDEAGRGPLAGAVFAAAVLLDPERPIEGLRDSKQLTEKQRDLLALEIRERAAAWCIAQADVAEIDSLNILQASLLAMARAVDGLSVKPKRVLVDGNQCPRIPYPTQAIVEGDALVPAIAAASILAKTARDAYMIELHQRYPQYAFDRHKGYATAVHLEALRRHGASPVHRRSFEPVRLALETGPVGQPLQGGLIEGQA